MRGGRRRDCGWSRHNSLGSCPCRWAIAESWRPRLRLGLRRRRPVPWSPGVLSEHMTESSRPDASPQAVWRPFVIWRRLIVLGFIPLQIAVVIVLVTTSAIQPGLVALAMGIALGFGIVGMFMLHSHRQLDRLAPANRLFGSVATVWASNIISSQLSMPGDPKSQYSQPKQSPIDGVCWIDTTGIHWRSRKPGGLCTFIRLRL